MSKHPFEAFLDAFIPVLARKTTQVNKAIWLLETTGSSDAADLKAELDAELRLLLSDPKVYQQLTQWDQDPLLKDPLLKRQLNVLIRTFKSNLAPKAILEELASREAKIAQSYANFRPLLDGKPLSENQIRELLKTENDPTLRKRVWELSKEVGNILAPQILALVALRNELARGLGYTDYFHMQLDIQEVDGGWLFTTLEDLATQSDTAYKKLIEEIETYQSKKFGVPKTELGPWAWQEPFCQENPLHPHDLDALVRDRDVTELSAHFYQNMGIDVHPTIARSDLFERPGKNQHAFCFDLDRKGDVRFFCNNRASMRWLETTLHELGHAIYYLGLDNNLPWLLREPAHCLTTEAMALIAGRQASRSDALHRLLGSSSQESSVLMQEAEKNLRNCQLIFSRWVLVVTFFEKELYRDPKQDLNRLWWHLVEKFQHIQPPQEHLNNTHQDWAAKYHIALAPVYYFNYLLGEMFASLIQEALIKKTGSANLDTQAAGQFLQEKLFHPANSLPWNTLILNMLGEPLTAGAWLRQFSTIE